MTVPYSDEQREHWNMLVAEVLHSIADTCGWKFDPRVWLFEKEVLPDILLRYEATAGRVQLPPKTEFTDALALTTAQSIGQVIKVRLDEEEKKFLASL